MTCACVPRESKLFLNCSDTVGHTGQMKSWYHLELFILNKYKSIPDTGETNTQGYILLECNYERCLLFIIKQVCKFKQWTLLKLSWTKIITVDHHF